MIQDQRIKQRALDQNLPRASALREYLASKDETAKERAQRPQSKYYLIGRIYDRPVRTLLIMPPTCLFEGAVKRVIPPLGLCYIAANLEANGFEIEILDCIVEGYDNEELICERTFRYGLSEQAFRERISGSDFDVFGFSMIYSSDIPNLYRYAEIVREEHPNSIIIAGGIHATIYARQFLEEGVRATGRVIDFVIRGEGEWRLLRFLENLQQGLVDGNSDGLAGWRDNTIFINPQYEQINDLDSLPFPAYHKVPLERYFRHNVPFSPYPVGERVMQIYTSRGCPVGCTFCASTNFAKAFRARSVANVIAEIKYLVERFAIDELQFADDNLTFNRTRTLELMGELKALRIPWCTPNGTMINTLDEEIIDAMADAGLYQITLSLDSGSAETLAVRHRKPVKLDRLPALMRYIQVKGVLMHGTLVIGMPGETEDEIKRGFNFVENLPFNSLNIFIAQAIPGSELFEKSLAGARITHVEARRIDTARSTLPLSTIAGKRLEQLMEEFLKRYNQIIRIRDPDAWKRKYEKHSGNFEKICVGKPSPNTSTIKNASYYEISG